VDIYSHVAQALLPVLSNNRGAQAPSPADIQPLVTPAPRWWPTGVFRLRRCRRWRDPLPPPWVSHIIPGHPSLACTSAISPQIGGGWRNSCGTAALGCV